MGTSEPHADDGASVDLAVSELREMARSLEVTAASCQGSRDFSGSACFKTAAARCRERAAALEMNAVVAVAGPETMTVRVRDLAAEEAEWGRYPFVPLVRVVSVSIFCPRCGTRRGEPYVHHLYAHDQLATVDRWDNPCGHVDKSRAVIIEADARP